MIKPLPYEVMIWCSHLM